MKFRLLNWLLAASLWLAPAAVWPQDIDARLRAEIASLRERQEQLRADIDQFQRSIELLRARQSGAGDAGLEALETRLEEAREELLALAERETLLQERLLGATAPRADPAAGKTKAMPPEQSEVARIRALLKQYYAAEALAAAQAAEADQPDAPQTPEDARAFSADKVLLNGPEGLAALRFMDQRLQDDSLPIQRRDIDVIFHVEIRENGRLISSSSHSLRALGRGQYVSKLRLEPGAATVSVRENEWTVDLGEGERSEFLFTLNLARQDSPELHVIPVPALRRAGWDSLPEWVPYLGGPDTAARR